MGEFKIGLVHGHQLVPWGDAEALGAMQRALDADILVSGKMNKKKEILQQSRSKSSPLVNTRSKLANPVKLSWGVRPVSTGVASFDRDLLIVFFRPGLL